MDEQRHVEQLREELSALEERLAVYERNQRFTDAILDAATPKDLVDSLKQMCIALEQPVSSIGLLRPIQGAAPGLDARLMQLLSADGLYLPFSGHVFPMEGTLSGSAFLTGSAQYAPEAKKHPETYIPEGVNGEAAEFAIPIMPAANRSLSATGVLFLRREQMYSFSLAGRTQVKGLVDTISRAFREKMTLFERQYDSGCPTFLNKGAGLQALENAYDLCIDQHLPFTLAFLDANEFKQKNDEYGHLIVDQALFTSTVALTQNLRHGDVAVRYGGDEFVIGFPNSTPAQIQSRFQKILDDLVVPAHAPLYKKGLAQRGFSIPDSLAMSFSVGMVGIDVAHMNLSQQMHLPRLSDLFGKADALVYEAKEAKKTDGTTVVSSVFP